MTDKKRPKIRMVSLDKKSPAENSGSRAADSEFVGKECTCDGYTPCTECLVQPTCGCEGGPESCPCMEDPPEGDSNPNSSSGNAQDGTDQDKQRQPKKGKKEHRTFFKIAGSEKNYYPLLPGLTREYRLKDLEGKKTVKIEVLSVSQEGAVTQGQCKRTENSPN